MPDRENIATFRFPKNVVAVRFSPDDSHLAVGDDSVVRLYPLAGLGVDADPRVLLEQAERQAGLRLDGFKLVDGEAH